VATFAIVWLPTALFSWLLEMTQLRNYQACTHLFASRGPHIEREL
jgi:hypothetical protein